MSNNIPKRKRSSGAYNLDRLIEEVCKNFLRTGKPISARSVAKKVGKAPSSITRDPFRSKLISEAKRQQQLIAETTERQSKRSRAKDAEVIAKQQIEIDRLKHQNNALLYSHKVYYNFIREIGGKEAYEKFLSTSISLKSEIIDAGGLDDLD